MFSRFYGTGYLVLVAGLEPARMLLRGILSPLRLPIPPHQQIKTTQRGLGPLTSAVTGRRSNQLSHWAILFICGSLCRPPWKKMDLRGLEPRTDRL